MAYSDRLTGSDLKVNFTPDGGSLVAITGDQTVFNFSRKMDTVDVTAGNETARAYRATIESMDWGLTIFDADQSYQADLLPGTEGLLEIYKKGDDVTAGEPIISMNVLITGYDEDFPFDGALEISISGVRQGAMVAEIGSVTT